MISGTINVKALAFCDEQPNGTYPSVWVPLPPVYFTGRTDFEQKLTDITTKHQHAEISVKMEQEPRD